MSQALLTVSNLTVAFGQNNVVNDISFAVNPGETFALVGESGSGKSMTALAVLRLLPNAATLCAQSVRLQQDELTHVTELDLCKIRGRRIGLIFQDPMASLNPVMTLGEQIAEVLRIHFDLSADAIRQRVLQLLQQVEIPEPQRRMAEYPHQLSGGQRQRVMIAIALAAEPALLIADEPTTALDVTIQAQILTLLKTLQRQTGMALWIISHDLALVSNVADRIAVMQKGKIVETADTQRFFRAAQHPYSLKLLDALPRLEHCAERHHKPKQPLLKVENFQVYYPIRKGLFKRVVGHVKAVDGVDFELSAGSTLALVGESGCGKTSMGKGLLNLLPTHGGRVWLDGVELTQLSGEDLRRQRSTMQIVFQDPFSSMNPRMLVGDIIAEGLTALRPDIGAELKHERVRELLRQVGLFDEAALRYPHEFSGGQRQRICIARALAVEPKLIICDEPTSALDVSVQAQIIALLKSLQRRQGISYLLITHSFGVVAEMADEVAVMYQGRIVERGPVQQVLQQPAHDYTRSLLAAVPRLAAVYG
ncbi:MAG: ABC transporter ATP-binding protein [Methylomonas sp.]|nr:ABC transporter ATP-binding protein [Methylomonas sp.]PPD20723.1 MAG: ABC transporter ATP-binding protein [Methylomonas sp.]PPD26220.1 MAG: ABC transporter ATP-binding protein [Methylomonas sp.]PPD37938.1 MAG: ABC transporter ATP-binding protein [Methylomonas sp.]PPD54624.1 MAG: ABC transporter ATP-binding protein [Methylomonas sp.]